MKLKLQFLLGLLVSCGFALGVHSAALADQAVLSTHSWDPGLYATNARYNESAHAWGQRKTGGAWGTGGVNYQSGDTTNVVGAPSGTLSVRLNATYCPNNNCSYGSGSGYKGLVQFWNDPSNFIAFGLIHDPGVSPNGMTLMIEGSANGKPIGGYWPAGAVTGASHQFTFTWTPGGIAVKVDGQVNLGPYPVTENHPSISFLAAGRNTGDIADTTFTNISFAPNSITPQPVVVPSSTPYATFSATMKQGGSGTGYSAYINTHDASNNALSIGVQTDSSAPETGGQPYYTWELVQNGQFTYDYIGAAASNTDLPVTLKWWSDSNTAVFYEGSTPIADIDAAFSPRLFFGVEGNARLNGDTVNDVFTNAQISVGNVCSARCGLTGSWNTSSFNFYGLHATNTNGQTQNGANFTVTGTVSGLPAGGTWDNNEVAGIGMIAQNYN